MTNQQVAQAWANGQAGASAHMHTDGRTIHSYELCIGEWRNNVPVVFNYTAREQVTVGGHAVPSEGFYRVTTSGHVRIARKVAGFAVK
ncbi:hypothetical protein LCGC14_0289580 [marine sediment metagenome]|uniref:Uncharacterized protein n=1 Tax=marine sediment metagenome TaxID=412755 RepID=A0A0F9WF34_9ZZZZ